MASPLRSIPPLANPATGENFVFVSSARTSSCFRFRWTLAAKRTGPPEHRHLDENETFTLRGGRLTVFVDGRPHELEKDVPFTAPMGVWHRFRNPGDEPAVIDVEMDGTALEDTMVPMAAYMSGREHPTMAEGLRIFVHDLGVGATERRSPIVTALFRFAAWLGRSVGIERFPRVETWG